MSTGFKSKMPLFLAALLALGLAGFFAFQWHKGNLLRQGIEKTLTMLPEGVTVTVGNIDIPLFGSSVTLSNITATMDSAMGPAKETVEQVRITGLNPAAFLPETGVIRLADTVEATGVQWTAPGLRMRVGSYRVEDLHGDAGWIIREYIKQWPVFQALADQAGSQAPEQALMQLGELADLMRALETVRIGRALIADHEMEYEFEIEEKKFDMRGKMEALEIKDYSLRAVGPMRARNMHFQSSAGKSMFSVATLGWDSVRLPSYADMVAFMGQPEVLENPELFGAKFLELLKEQPLAFDNLYLSDLGVGDTEGAQGPLFTLKDGSISYVLRGSAQDLRLHYSGAAVDKDQLLSADLDIPEEAFALLPATLVMDGALDVSVANASPKSTDVDCRLLRLALKDVGEASLGLTVTGINVIEMVMGRLPSRGTLVRHHLNLTDLTASNILLAQEAANRGPGITPEAVREQIVAQALEAAQALPEGPFRTVAENLAQFLRAPGGSFEVTVQPPQPLPLNELQPGLLAAPEKLGLSSSFTPGK